MIMNYLLGRAWKEAVNTHFKVPTHNFPGLRKTTKEPMHIWYQAEIQNRGLLNMKRSVKHTPWHLVSFLYVLEIENNFEVKCTFFDWMMWLSGQHSHLVFGSPGFDSCPKVQLFSFCFPHSLLVNAEILHYNRPYPLPAPSIPVCHDSHLSCH